MGRARETMDRLTEAVFKKDFDTLRSLYAPDAVTVTPDAGELTGPDAAVLYLKEFLDAFPDAEYQSLYQHETGDTAIDEGYFVATHTQPLPLPEGESLAPTGRQVRLRSCDFLTVEGDLVRSHRIYFDQAQLLDQLGLSD